MKSLFLQYEFGQWETPLNKTIKREFGEYVTQLNRIQKQIHILDNAFKGTTDFLMNINLARYGNYTKALKLKNTYIALSKDLRQNLFRQLWIETFELFSVIEKQINDMTDIYNMQQLYLKEQKISPAASIQEWIYDLRTKDQFKTQLMKLFLSQIKFFEVYNNRNITVSKIFKITRYLSQIQTVFLDTVTDPNYMKSYNVISFQIDLIKNLRAMKNPLDKLIRDYIKLEERLKPRVTIIENLQMKYRKSLYANGEFYKSFISNYNNSFTNLYLNYTKLSKALANTIRSLQNQHSEVEQKIQFENQNAQSDTGLYLFTKPEVVALNAERDANLDTMMNINAQVKTVGDNMTNAMNLPSSMVFMQGGDKDKSGYGGPGYGGPGYGGPGKVSTRCTTPHSEVCIETNSPMPLEDAIERQQNPLEYTKKIMKNWELDIEDKEKKLQEAKKMQEKEYLHEQSQINLLKQKQDAVNLAVAEALKTDFNASSPENVKFAYFYVTLQFTTSGELDLNNYDELELKIAEEYCNHVEKVLGLKGEDVVFQHGNIKISEKSKGKIVYEYNLNLKVDKNGKKAEDLEKTLEKKNTLTVEGKSLNVTNVQLVYNNDEMAKSDLDTGLLAAVDPKSETPEKRQARIVATNISNILLNKNRNM